MSTDRTQRLSPSDLALKLACREAVKAAGGQDFVAGETGRTQSRISDYCSPNTRDFMPADLIAKVEALGAGSPGHPHITRALVRAQGLAVIDPDQTPVVSVVGALGDVASESGDVIRLLAKAIDGGLSSFADLSTPNRRQEILHEIDQLIDLLTGIAARIADGVGTDSS
jgi:hypothetical protein